MGACESVPCLPLGCLEGTSRHFVVVPHISRQNLLGDESPVLGPVKETEASGSDHGSPPRLPDAAFGKKKGGLGGIVGRPCMRKQLEADLEGTPRSARVSNILCVWDLRGANRPITDFYTLQQTLGSGNYGVVQKWRLKIIGEEETDEPYVAVKLIKWSSIWEGRSRNREHVKQIRNELKMLLVLDHPFVVRFREWFEEKKGIYFVMELCSGRSLQDLLEDICKLPTREERRKHLPRMRRHFREIAYAVSYIHGLEPPVVHRDLKPDNVLLKSDTDPNSCVKLIDFGLACLRSHSGGGGNFQKGTELFMAPEQFFSAEGQIEEAADNWALGVIFAWIVTAVELGSLQHPMLSLEQGRGFDVDSGRLSYAYARRLPWNRELFATHEEAACSIADRMLVYNPQERAKAAEILADKWVRSGDPSAAAAAQLLGQGSVISNLMSYHSLSSFDKKVLFLVADNAHDAQIECLRRTFRALDTSKTGKLSRHDLVDGFRSNDVELPPATIEAIFQAMDSDGSGRVEYHEWLGATIGSRILCSERTIRTAFRCLDARGTGTISRAELAHTLGEEATAVLLADRALQDERGNITLEGFRSLMRGIAARRHALPQARDMLESAASHPTRRRSTTVFGRASKPLLGRSLSLRLSGQPDAPPRNTSFCVDSFISLGADGAGPRRETF